MLARIRELHAANYDADGYRRMWKALLRVGAQVRRCRVQRLGKRNGIDLVLDALRMALRQRGGADVELHLVGEGDDIVVQFGVGDAAIWIAPASSTMKRLDPRAIDGATSRTLLVVDDRDAVTARDATTFPRHSPATARASGRQHRLEPAGSEFNQTIFTPAGGLPVN